MKNRKLAMLMLTTLLAAACKDDPAEPPRVATTVVVNAGDAQAAEAGSGVAANPAVQVKDQKGRALAGVNVQFTVTLGGGSIDFATAQTNAEGIASPGRWLLGSVPGQNMMEATVEGLPVIRFTATATSPFHVTVRYILEPTPTQRLAVENAVERWRRAIIRDLTDISMTIAANRCFATQPAVTEVVDDLLLFVEFKAIDGVGSVLGQAGPCFIRNDNSLPILGYLQLDAADLANQEARGTLNDLITHEIGHVLGIGALWNTKQLLVGAATDDPHFTGASALAEYRALGGTAAGVPVENTGSSGTRNSHWRESVFRNELMTGFLSAVPNSLSAMTVASLQDLGYTTNVDASDFFSLNAVMQQQAPLLDLHIQDRVILPLYRVDRRGTIVSISN